MTDTTYQTATRCPWCEMPGKKVSSAPVTGSVGLAVQHGTRLETFECVNERCANGPRFNEALGEKEPGERWAVQINPDGTIPPKGAGLEGPKAWDIGRVTTEAERERARDMLAQEVERQQRGGV
jgi:hypothetical protein